MKLFITCVILKLVDVVTTYIALVNRPDFEGEGNPIMKWLMYNIGFVPALFVAFAWTLLFLVLILKRAQGRFQTILFGTVIFLLTLVGVNNIMCLVL